MGLCPEGWDTYCLVFPSHNSKGVLILIICVMCLQWCRNEHNSLCSCCRMNWTWRIRTGRPCSLCLMRRNGRSTAARRRWVGLCLIVPNISSNLWLALSWLAAWSHSLELNCQQRMLLKAASYQNSFWKSLPRFLSLYWRKHMHLLCQLFLFFFAASSTSNIVRGHTVHKCAPRPCFKTSITKCPSPLWSKQFPCAA